MAARIRESKDRFIAQSLQVISVDQKSKIEKWFNKCCSILGDVSSDAALTMLYEESEQSEKGKTAFIFSVDINKRVKGLTHAECAAVTMYSCGEPADYYEEFNRNCRNGQWEKYKIFSALLFSACMKLAIADPVEPGEVLYRGLGTPLKPPFGEFFWGQFLSTTSSSSIAKQFGMATKIEISQCEFGARISKLSVFEDEQEILILPFEAFVHKETVNSIQKYELRSTQPFALQSVKKSQQAMYDACSTDQAMRDFQAAFRVNKKDEDTICELMCGASGSSIDIDYKMKEYMKSVNSRKMDDFMRGIMKNSK